MRAIHLGFGTLPKGWNGPNPAYSSAVFERKNNNDDSLQNLRINVIPTNKNLISAYLKELDKKIRIIGKDRKV